RILATSDKSTIDQDTIEPFSLWADIPNHRLRRNFSNGGRGPLWTHASIRLLLRTLCLILTGGKGLDPFLSILFLHQDFHLTLRIFQHLETGLRQPDPFLENFQRIVEWQITF